MDKLKTTFGIDSVVMTWSLNHQDKSVQAEAEDMVLTFFRDLFNQQKVPVSLARKNGYKEAYNLVMPILPEYKKKNNFSYLLVQMRPRNPEKSFLRFTYNPGKLSSEGIDKIRHTFQELTTILNFHKGFPDFLDRIRLTQFDIFIDVLNVSIEDLGFFKNGAQKWEFYPETRVNGDTYIRGLYLGKNNGQNQFCIYDKTHQLKNCHGVNMGQERTRIEARCQNTVLLKHIHKIKNPFDKLSVLNLKLLKPGNRSGQLEVLFMDSVRRRGPQAALKLIKNKKTKERFRKKILASCKADWWKPDVEFKQLPQAIKNAGLDFLKCN